MKGIECYFLYKDGYDREAMKYLVGKIGYEEREREGLIPSLKYCRDDTVVNFTSGKEGKMQIQAYSSFPKEDILELRDNLSPDNVVNMGCCDINLDEL